MFLVLFIALSIQKIGNILKETLKRTCLCIFFYVHLPCAINECEVSVSGSHFFSGVCKAHDIKYIQVKTASMTRVKSSKGPQSCHCIYVYVYIMTTLGSLLIFQNSAPSQRPLEKLKKRSSKPLGTIFGLLELGTVALSCG